MTRRELRETVFQILFGMEFNKEEDMREQAETFLMTRDEKYQDSEREYIVNRVVDVAQHRQEIDKTIESISEGWKLNRIGKPELAILRLAVYEIRFDEDIPVKVAINEAVELTKQFCDPEAKSFVNALLAKIA